MTHELLSAARDALAEARPFVDDGMSKRLADSCGRTAIKDRITALLARLDAELARPAAEPVMLRDIIAWLEGTAANTDTSPKWRAATELRRVPEWEGASTSIAAPAAPSAEVVYQCPRCATSMQIDPTAKPDAAPAEQAMARDL